MSEQRYVYLLGDHDEGGTENALATLDREKLPALLDAWMDGLKQKRPHDPQVAIYRDNVSSVLGTLMKLTDEELCERSPLSMTVGWGGVQLHVVKLLD